MDEALATLAIFLAISFMLYKCLAHTKERTSSFVSPVSTLKQKISKSMPEIKNPFKNASLNPFKPSSEGSLQHGSAQDNDMGASYDYNEIVDAETQSTAQKVVSKISSSIESLKKKNDDVEQKTRDDDTLSFQDKFDFLDEQEVRVSSLLSHEDNQS